MALKNWAKLEKQFRDEEDAHKKGSNEKDVARVDKWREDAKEFLEPLSDPELFEKRMEKVLRKNEINTDFADSSLETRASIGEITGELGGEKVSEAEIKGAREMMKELKESLRKLRSLDMKDISVKAAAGVKKFLKENLLNLTPTLLMPLAAFTGGDMTLASMASAELTVGMFALDKVLDSVMTNAEEVLPPQYLVALIAGTTNLAELGASQASALAGDPLSEVAATPIGSNPTNVYLTAFALVGALKERAVKEEIVKEGEKVTYKHIKQTLNTIEWKKIKKEIGKAGAFAVDALIFQYYVRPQMKAGNLIPLAGWTVVNIPLLIEYFRRTTFSKKTQIRNMSENIGDDNIEALRKEYMEDEGVNRAGVTPLFEMLEAVKMLKMSEEKTEQGKATKDVQKALTSLKKMVEEDDVFKEDLAAKMSSVSMQDVEALLRLGKIKLKDEAVDKKKVAKLVAGAGAVALLSVLLDKGVTNMADALPYLGKGAAGFFIMSFFSSVGEFMTTKKFFEQGTDADAVKNITDSNAINLGLAQGAMATRSLSGLI